MNNQTKTAWPSAVYAVMFIIMYFLTYTEILPIKIGNAAPMPIIAAVVAVAFFYGEWVGFTVGLIAGVFIDGVASHSVCFNMIILMAIGLAVGIVVNKYLNKNIYSAVLLSLMACGVYFFAHWLIFYVFEGHANASRYLLLYCLPSAVYSALFIFPAYLPGRYLK